MELFSKVQLVYKILYFYILYFIILYFLYCCIFEFDLKLSSHSKELLKKYIIIALSFFCQCFYCQYYQNFCQYLATVASLGTHSLNSVDTLSHKSPASSTDSVNRPRPLTLEEYRLRKAQM